MSETSLTPRSRILRRLERDPGLHLREVARRTDLSLGTVRYHLSRLEEGEAVVRHTTRGFVRWFPRRGLSVHDRALISAIRVYAQRALIGALLESDSARFSALRATTSLSPATLSRNLQKLGRMGLLTRGEGGVYRLADPAAVRSGLARYRRRFPDFLAEAAVEVFEGR
ncbi:MAG: winged helix-turn-helix transcriptional regulator [Thermoplasmata archaeon]